MANIKSALKRIKVNETKRARNKSKKSELKTYMKKLNIAIEEDRLDDAAELLKLVDKKLKKAASKNLIHKNAASRKLSSFQRKLNSAKEA